MNETGNTVSRNAEFVKKLGLCLRVLLAFDLLFLAYLLGGYVHGHGSLGTLLGALGQVLLVAGMQLNNMALQSEHNAKLKNTVSVILFICFCIILVFQFRLL